MLCCSECSGTLQEMQSLLRYSHAICQERMWPDFQSCKFRPLTYLEFIPNIACSYAAVSCIMFPKRICWFYWWKYLLWLYRQLVSLQFLSPSIWLLCIQFLYVSSVILKSLRLSCFQWLGKEMYLSTAFCESHKPAKQVLIPVHFYCSNMLWKN